ncbi:MAG: spermidine synthase [Desulfobacterales bacterium]|nr:spermidine synthase [Desulfobacterales bacterium]
MPLSIEELDFQETAMGELVLRRRRMRSLNDRVVYEVKLGDEYLMSSLFHEAEVALADIGLGVLGGDGWDVVVGGLGLGYTAAAALKFKALKRLVVVEALAPVIDWHRRALVPNGEVLGRDGRCVYHHADFFALVRGEGFDPERPGGPFDAVLLDIDHTPEALLNASHAGFYTEAGLSRLKTFLKPGGVFALWSNDPPEDHFLEILGNVFARAQGHTIEFENPLQQSTSSNGVYVARCS